MSLNYTMSAEYASRLSFSNNGLYLILPPPVTFPESTVQSNDICILDTNEAKPTETCDEKYKMSPEKISTPSKFIKCKECGKRCLGLKGIQMHTNMVHKQEYKPSLNTSENDSIFEKNEQLKKIEMKSAQENDDHSIIKDVRNFNPHSGPGFFDEVDELRGPDDMLSLEVNSGGSFNIYNKNIKAKPTNSSVIKYKKSDKNISTYNKFLKYRKCGKQCSGSKGIKIHTNKVHKPQTKHSSNVSQTVSFLRKIKQTKPNEVMSVEENGDHAVLFPNNGVKTLNLNTEPGLLDEVHQLNSSDDIFSFQKESSSASSKRKAKPTKTSGKKYKRYKKLSASNKFKCSLCGMMCSGPKEIKMHTIKVHKLGKKYSTSQCDLTPSLDSKCSSAASQSDPMFKNNTQGPEESKQKSEQQNADHPNLLPDNSGGNFSLNMQTGLFGSLFPQSNIVTDYNGPTVQLVYDPGNEVFMLIPTGASGNDSALMKSDTEESRIKSVQENTTHPIIIDLTNPNLNPEPGSSSNECSSNDPTSVPGNANEKILVIPQFEYTCENYRWLRKFVYQCKKQEYPFSPIMCQNIIRVLDQLSNAIGTSPVEHALKIDHYMFYRLFKILTECLDGHMKYSLCS